MRKCPLAAALLVVGFFARAPLAAEPAVAQPAPDFAATNAAGEEVKLSSFRGGNVVLVFTRAHTCPFCMKQLIELRKAGDDLKRLGATVVVVQREDKLRGEGLKRTAASTKAEFVFLDDLDAKKTADYSKGSYSTYIIDSEGFVRHILAGTKTNRPSAENIVARLGEIAPKDKK
jgi:peroxiredoxin